MRYIHLVVQLVISPDHAHSTCSTAPTFNQPHFLPIASIIALNRQLITITLGYRQKTPTMQNQSPNPVIGIDTLSSPPPDKTLIAPGGKMKAWIEVEKHQIDLFKVEHDEGKKVSESWCKGDWGKVSLRSSGLNCGKKVMMVNRD